MIRKFQNIFHLIIAKALNKKTILLHFASGQFIDQLLSFIISFFLLRWLTIEEQAKFSVTFSIQSTIGLISDLGITGSVMALVGTNYNNKEIVGKYISSAAFLRYLLLILSAVILISISPFIIKKQGWSLTEGIVLILMVIVTTLAIGRNGILQSTLLVHQQVKKKYNIQNFSSLIRLILTGVFKLTSSLNAISVFFTNSLAFVFQSFMINRASKVYYSKVPANKDAVKEIIKYITPIFPSAVFYAFQSQIMLFIISIFGNTQNIAEVAALGRLGQLFVFINAFFGTILVPYLVRAENKDLKKKYLTALIIATSIYVPFVLLSFFFPDIFLLYLGPKFYDLKSEIFLTILSVSIVNIQGLIWLINAGRNWVKKWYAFFYIGGILSVQIVCVYLLPVHHTRGVLWMSIFTAAYVLLLQAAQAYFGLKATKPL